MSEHINRHKYRDFQFHSFKADRAFLGRVTELHGGQADHLPVAGILKEL
jgi:hypothetical protein